MSEPSAGWRRRLIERLSALLQHGGAPLAFQDGPLSLPLRVLPLRASGGRPDGLRHDAPADVGFSFAVASAVLELDTSGLDLATAEAVHEVLFSAGSDDWMDYSHFHPFDPAKLAADPKLGLSFSSAPKGADVIAEVLAVLSSAVDRVDVILDRG